MHVVNFVVSINDKGGWGVPEKLIFWLKELGQEFNDVVGKKCANLGEMSKVGVTIPDGFAISIPFYRRFLELTRAANEMERCVKDFGELHPEDVESFENLSLKLREIIEGREMPLDLAGQVSRYYEEMCERRGEEIPVSVRSSGPKSRPGMFETYLNVKGKHEIIQKVKSVWASAFTPRALAFRVNKGIPILGDELGVGVVSMVAAKAAGITFTADPNTGDKTRVIVEANWGLGESVVSGHVTPDRWVVDKSTLEIRDRYMGKKESFVRIKETGVAEVETPNEKKECFCLSDEEVREVTRLSVLLERYFGTPQDTEWALDETLSFPHNVFFLQTRPVVISKRDGIEQALDIMVTRLFK